MKIKETLLKNNFSPEAVDAVLSSGIETFYPPQAEAIKKGILDKKNFLMSVPTAAGKTFIAELCMVKSILQNQGRCLYIAPLKALASEKYKDFKKKYAPLKIKVGITIGDTDTPKGSLSEYDILLATAEKVDSLLRSRAKWLIESLSVVVLDEIHFINDGLRGPTLEILTARIRQLNPNIQIVALSATVSNAAEVAGWLNAELVSSTWRPIPLKEGVYFHDKINFDGYGTRLIREEGPDDLNNLVLDTMRGRGQALIFVNSRRSAQAVSRQICQSVTKILTKEERTELAALAKKVIGQRADTTKLCQKLADVVFCGAAFHHAGLKPHQRELIEESFKKNLIKVISCTPTLAAGVNLPARRAIIRDVKRFESGLGAAYIPTAEYKQCAGRAGRPQYDEYGEAILIAKSYSDAEILFEHYIQADPEPVISKLSNESTLRIHILASITGGYVHDVNSMLDFMGHTFLSYQKRAENLLDIVTRVFDFLHQESFIEKSGYRFFPTPFGQLTSRLYIDPLSSIILRDGLTRTDRPQPLPPLGVIHLTTCCPDGITLNVGKKGLDELERFATETADELILTPENYSPLEDYYLYYATAKATWLIHQWMEEKKEDALCDRFNIGPGDIYRCIEATEKLLYASAAIADLLRNKSLAFHLKDIRTRVRYGVKPDLLKIVQLKGVGRMRARTLFEKGYCAPKDLRSVSADQLSNVPLIGKTLARKLIDQAAAWGLNRKKTPPTAPTSPTATKDEWTE